MTSRLRIVLLSLLAVVTLAGCPKPPPTDMLDDAQAALDAAALAERCAEAEFRAAQNLLAQARAAYEDEDYERAQQLALAAQEQAARAREVAERNREECDRIAAMTQQVEERATEQQTRTEAIDDSAYRLERIYFEFNTSALSDQARATLDGHAEYLRRNPEVDIIIQGHCDDRGSTEYNLALGERRARSVKDYLQRLGVDGRRMTIVSYGEEVPLGTHDENRRAEFVVR